LYLSGKYRFLDLNVNRESGLVLKNRDFLKISAIQLEKPQDKTLWKLLLLFSFALPPTAYALHGLLDLRKSGIFVSDSVINSLTTKVVTSKNESHWNNGVYFSVGTVIRNLFI
jgi:hypothetical protein